MYESDDVACSLVSKGDLHVRARGFAVRPATTDGQAESLTTNVNGKCTSQARLYVDFLSKHLHYKTFGANDDALLQQEK